MTRVQLYLYCITWFNLNEISLVHSTVVKRNDWVECILDHPSRKAHGETLPNFCALVIIDQA